MFGQFFWVRQKIFCQRFIFRSLLAARACSGDRSNGDFSIAEANQNFWAGADQRKRAEIQMKEKRGWIKPAKGAVQRECGQGERNPEALTWDNLKNVSGKNVLLRPQHHRVISLASGAGSWFAGRDWR